jgi:hypothetical protein
MILILVLLGVSLSKFTTLNDALLFNPITLYVPECA